MPWLSHVAGSYADTSHTTAGHPVHGPAAGWERRCSCTGCCFLVPTAWGTGRSISAPNVTSPTVAATVAITLFLDCALGQKQINMQACVSPAEKDLCVHGTASTAITLKNTSSHWLRVRLSKSHTEYRPRRWTSAPGGRDRLLEGPAAARPARDNCNAPCPSPFRSPRPVVVSGL